MAVQKREAGASRGGARLAKKEPAKKAPKQRRKHSGGGAAVLALCAVIVAGAAGYGGVCYKAVNHEGFFPGTVLNGINVEGLTEKKAAEKLAGAISAETCKVFLQENGVVDNEPVAELTLEQLGVTGAGCEEASQKALREQTDYSFPEAGYRFILSLMNGTELSEELPVDRNILEATAAELAASLHEDAEDASYRVEGSKIFISIPKQGRDISEKELLSALEDAAADFSESVTVEVKRASGKDISAKSIYEEIASEMKNAGYDPETGKITPEQYGASFDVAKAQVLIDAAEPGSTVELEATLTSPTVTAADLQKVIFHDVLGECTTKVGGTAGRISNVKLAASAINNMILNTGDVFSYNDAVGKRTAERGFKPAPAYVGGETVDEIGGGICQVSSTLYKACLLADMNIVVRAAHRYAPSYIDWGMDATVSWGGPEYKFSNDTDYPVKIVTSYANGYLTVKLLGTKTNTNTIKLTNKVLSNTEWKTVYQEDPTIAPGTEKVKTTPYTGHKVECYKSVYDASGKLISTTLVNTSDYKVRNKVILRAPGEAAEGALGTAPVAGAETPGTAETPAPDATAPAAPETPAVTQPAEPAPAPAAPAPAEPAEDPVFVTIG